MENKTTVGIDEIKIEGITYVPKNSQMQMASSVDNMPFVMIRSDRSGVHFGYLQSKEIAGDKWNVKLLKSRRVFYWSGAASITQLALDGTNNPNACKFAMELPEIDVAGAIEIIPITQKAEINLKGVAIWKL